WDATLSIDTAHGNAVQAFWLDSNVIYTNRGVSPYAAGNWGSVGTALVNTGTNASLTSAYRDGNGYAGLLWTEGTGSPYNVRFFGRASTSATDVGSALAALNTAATAPAQGTSFRLRMLTHVATSNLGMNGGVFKLQFAGKGAGSCASPSGTPSSYTDL